MVTRQSPRITESGVLKWYEGDSFDLNYDISLTKDGETIEFADGDKFIVSFYHDFDRENVVHTFTCTDIEDLVVGTTTEHYITLAFTPTISKLFKPGRYSYCIKYFDSETGYYTTIVAKRRAEVEECH